MIRRLGLAVLTFSSIAWAQLDFENIHVNFFLPTVADGVASGQQARTTFTFTNPAKAEAVVTLELFANDGGGLTVGIGSVRTSSFRITLPAGATRSYTTNGDNPTVRNGWAIITSSHPIGAYARIAELQGTTTRTDALIESSVPTIRASADVTGQTVLSLANVYDDAETNVRVAIKSTAGAEVTSIVVPVPPLGRVSFALPDAFAGMPATFSGSVLIEGATPSDIFVAGVVDRDRAGGLRGGRPARLLSPASHYDNLWLTYKRILSAAKAALPDVNLDDIEFKVSFDKVINAYAANGKEVVVYIALAQLINDSPSELAFVIAHELGHILQQRSGVLVFNPNPEFDADSWGALLALLGGYDPYGSAGALSRLAMASGRAGLVTQFEDQLSDDAHKSFNERLSSIYDMVGAMCSASDQAKAGCAAYKSIMHPHLPSNVPLTKGGDRAVQPVRVRTERTTTGVPLP